MAEHYLDRLARIINENWDSPALTDFYLTEDSTAQDTSRGNHYTYGEMYEEILHVCDIFQSLGLQKGDHIAICGANSAHWAITYLAIAAYQGVVVTILHSQSPEDIAHQIDFSDAKALFTDPELWEELKDKSLPQIGHIISLVDWSILRGTDIPIKNHRSQITNRGCQFSHGEPDDLAMICFTSGSTGKSKGVMLTNTNVSVNASNGSKSYPNGLSNNVLLFIPIAHVLCLYGDFLGQLVKGKAIFFLSEISIKTIYCGTKILEPYAMNIIPHVVLGLLHFGDLSILGKCQQIYVGGAKLDDALYEELRKADIHCSMGYGLTETGPISWSIYYEYKKGTCGRIAKGLIFKISPAGEILVKGENVMLGYYKDPEATARKIDAEGWLHTGDKGHLDEDGYLYVEGRLEQDMIVLPNGENIHPEDIERKINALPEVSESIVFARDCKLVAIVVPSIIENRESKIGTDALRRHVLRTINPELPLYSQLYDVEITDVPLQKTEKQTIKRYLYR